MITTTTTTYIKIYSNKFLYVLVLLLSYRLHFFVITFVVVEVVLVVVEKMNLKI